MSDFKYLTRSHFFYWGGCISLLPKERKKVKSLSCVQLFATPWTVAHQAPPSMEFSRQEYWSGLPFTSPGDLPDPRIKPRSPALQAYALPSEPPGKHFPAIKCTLFGGCIFSLEPWLTCTIFFNKYKFHVLRKSSRKCKIFLSSQFAFVLTLKLVKHKVATLAG